MSLFFSIISILFRFIAYTYLRWIPGRQATYSIPILFLITSYPLIKQVFISPTKESTTIITKTIEVVKTGIIPIESFNSTDSENERIGNKRGQSNTIRRKKGSGNSTPTKILNNNPIESIDTVVVKEVVEELIKPERITKLEIIKSLILGIKSKSNLINLLTLFINLLILTSVLDSIFTPIFFLNENDLIFTRVSGLTHDKVKIFARIPNKLDSIIDNVNSNNNNITNDLLELEKDEFNGAKIEYRTTIPIGKWIKGGNLIVDEKKDWTGILELENLYSSTEYEYRLLLPSLSHSHHPSFNLQKFKTFPDPKLSSPLHSNSQNSGSDSSTHYSFVSSSCLKPNFPYKGPFSHGSIPGLRYLSDEIEKREEGGGGGVLRFLLFLGDFIYADTPFFPKSSDVEVEREHYFKRYRQVFASEDMKRVVEKLPLISIYDDHEIYNDFSSNETDHHFIPANEAFVSYLGSVNPSSTFSSSSPSSSNSESETETEPINYFNFQHGDSAFFILDTRAYRSPNSLPDTAENEKTMLGIQQKNELKEWCREVNETITFKFLISSIPFMSLWSSPYGSGDDDTWSGFGREREEILDLLEFMDNVIILSGDRHEFAAASLRNGKITEFSTSPLSQFYLPIRTLSQSNGRGKTGEDILLKYLPDGNSKFTTFEIDTRNQSKPIIKIKVIIDGNESWSVDLLGKPLDFNKVRKENEKGLGGLGLSLLQLLGFKKRSWF